MYDGSVLPPVPDPADVASLESVFYTERQSAAAVLHTNLLNAHLSALFSSYSEICRNHRSAEGLYSIKNVMFDSDV